MRMIEKISKIIDRIFPYHFIDPAGQMDFDVRDSDSSVSDVLPAVPIEINNTEVIALNRSHGCNIIGNNFGVINYYPCQECAHSENSVDVQKRLDIISNYTKNGKYKTALKLYAELTTDCLSAPLDASLHVRILMGMLSCYINCQDFLNADQVISRINRLGNTHELNRFYFLCAVYYANQGDLDQAYIFIEQSLKNNPDYLKAHFFREFILLRKGHVDAIQRVRELILQTNANASGLDDSELAELYGLAGHISMIGQLYDQGLELYGIAYEKNQLNHYQAMMGIIYFYKAIRSAEYWISYRDLNFDELEKAYLIFRRLSQLDDQEEREHIMITIAPAFLRCAYFFNDLETFEIAQRVPFLDRTDNIQEIYRMRAQMEMRHGSVGGVTMAGLADLDKAWVHIVDLMERKQYEQIIKEITPFLDSSFKDSTEYHLLIMECFAKLGDWTSYNRLKALFRSKGMNSHYPLCFESCMFECEGKIEKAADLMESFAAEQDDFGSYMELASFYGRNNMNRELKWLYEQLHRHKEIIIPWRVQFYSRYIVYLLNNGCIYECEELFDELDDQEKATERFIRMQAAIDYASGDYAKARSSFSELYKNTNDLEDLFHLMLVNTYLGNIDDAEEQANILIRRGYHDPTVILMALSDMAILKNEIDLSFEYAMKAKDMVRELPGSPVHPFFVNRSIRCGKEEGFSHIHEYSEMYPQNQTWLKTFHTPTICDSGEPEISDDLKTVLVEIKNHFDEVMKAYKDKIIGFPMLARAFGRSVLEIVDWRDIYNIPIRIFHGPTNILNDEICIEAESLVVDSLSLYILAEIDALDLLHNYERVFVPFSVLKKYHELILKAENQLARAVIDFIHNCPNIILTHSKSYLYSEFVNKYRGILDQDQLDCLVIANDRYVSYLYSDCFIPNIGGVANCSVMSIVALLYQLLQNDTITIERHSRLVRLLVVKRYWYVNFTALNLYNIAIESNSLIEDLTPFFKIDGENDPISYIRTHHGLVRILIDNNRIEMVSKICSLFIDAYASYYARAGYDLFMLEKEYNIFMDYFADDSILPVELTVHIFMNNSNKFQNVMKRRIVCNTAYSVLLSLLKERLPGREDIYNDALERIAVKNRNYPVELLKKSISNPE